jgi:aspartyl-tRNA(Asn)/glutamyl-tRNA(Gln) amidotransferase subunit A
MTADLPAGLSIATARRMMSDGELSPLELTRACLDRIDALDARTRAFITVTADAALEDARRAERRLKTGAAGPLEGVPISLKDLFDTQDVPTTAGSKIFADRIPDRDATVVARLRAAGAVLVGKTNMHEFAYGVTSQNPHYGDVLNPRDFSRIAGGSSGGSATSVALGMALGSLGTDTGGSIRIPSALSGTVGLKPTWGRVSGTGVLPLAWSFDTFGPMTRTVEDAALLLEVIAGLDASDTRTRLAPEAAWLPGDLDGGISGWRFGVPYDALDRIDAEIAALVQAALSRLEALGGRLVEIDCPGAGRHEPIFRSMAGFEVLSFHEKYLDERPQDYGPQVRARMEAGRDVTRRDYLEARQGQLDLIADLNECFGEVDVIACPTIPIPAPRVGEDPVAVADTPTPTLLVLTRNNRLFSITGMPAISVPCGFTAAGLPAGLQLAGPMFQEGRLLRAARAYEQDAAWDLSVP